MNATLLLQIKEQILREPDRFIMSDWVVGSTAAAKAKKETFVKEYDDLFDDGGCITDLSECGTAACIGGWACLLTNTSVVVRNEFELAAARVLGIEPLLACELFNISYWPEDLSYRWRASRSKRERALIAAERIDRYVDNFCPNFRRNYEEANQQDSAA